MIDGIEFELIGGPLDGRRVRILEAADSYVYLPDEWRNDFLDNSGCLKPGLIPLYVQQDDSRLLYFKLVDFRRPKNKR
jgi:hypothetical protein